MTDQRLEGLEAFVRSTGAVKEPVLLPLGGDASFRRYFRCGSYIAVDSPPATQKNREFVAIDRALAQAGVRVPKIIACDLKNGYLLEEDLGDLSFAKATSGRNRERRLPLYKKALAVIPAVASAKPEGGLPAFDADFIRMEFGIFTEWMLDKTLHLSISDADRAMLDETLDRLIRNSLEQPQVAVHRDFHSRNLMCVGDKLAVIDFQDMVTGPITYDAASLLFDCYVTLDQYELNLLEPMLHNLTMLTCLFNGIKYGPDFETFDRQLRTVSLQRHLKVLGIFMRLKLRDGKDGYLKDLPRVMNYCLDESMECGFDDLHDFLQLYVKPCLDTVLEDYGIDPDQED